MLRQVQLPRILAGSIDETPVVFVHRAAGTVKNHLVENGFAVGRNRDRSRPMQRRVIVGVEGMLVCRRGD